MQHNFKLTTMAHVNKVFQMSADSIWLLFEGAAQRAADHLETNTLHEAV
jgi:hypothetical protein